MSWVDVFDVTDIVAVRARYEAERVKGGYEIPDLRGPTNKTDKDPDESLLFRVPRLTKLGSSSRKRSLL
jgi:hypothetical protein